MLLWIAAKEPKCSGGEQWRAHPDLNQGPAEPLSYVPSCHLQPHVAGKFRPPIDQQLAPFNTPGQVRTGDLQRVRLTS